MGSNSVNGLGNADRPNEADEGLPGGGPGLGAARPDGGSAEGDRRPGGQRVATPPRKPRRPDRASNPASATERLASAALTLHRQPTYEDEHAGENWPALYACLRALKDINGDDCEPASFSVNVRAGRLAWSLRIPAYNVRAAGWADSLATVLSTLERALASQETVFQPLKKHVAVKFRKKAEGTA